VRTAKQMRATLQTCHDAGDHDEALEVAADVTAEVEATRRTLVERLLALAADLDAEATRLAESGTINELGVVQHRGGEIDRLCGIYRTLARYAERAQKAAGIDPNAGPHKEPTVTTQLPSDPAAVLAEELPRLRGRIDAIRAEANGLHADLAKVYRTDAADLAAIADACDAGHYLAAARHVERLDTAVRDELGQRLYDAIRALAAGGKPRRHEGVAYSGDAADVLMDALKDNLSPQAVAAVVAYLQPAHTSNPEVDRQLRWFAERLTELVGGPEQLNRLTDSLGL